MSGIPVWVALQGLIRGANVENYFCISKRGLVFFLSRMRRERGRKGFAGGAFFAIFVVSQRLEMGRP